MAFLTAQVWFDGSAAPTNPGPAMAGAYIEIEDREPVRLCRRLGVQTNNVAEWEALILALEHCLQEGVNVAMVRGDSRLIVNQANGSWKVKHPNMKPLKAKVDALLSRFLAVSFEWIPRERNTEADAASRGIGSIHTARL